MRDQPGRPGKSVLWALLAVALAAAVGAGGLLACVRPLGASHGIPGASHGIPGASRGMPGASEGMSAMGGDAWAGVAYRPDNLVRLHVLANSDRPEDQALKLCARDEVLRFLSPRFEGVHGREQALEVLRQNQAQLASLLEGLVTASGEEYGVAVEIGDFPFPERTYGSLTVPAGVYPALRVVLGEGAGHNWWCVLFPPLCFLDARVGNSLDPALDPTVQAALVESPSVGASPEGAAPEGGAREGAAPEGGAREGAAPGVVPSVSRSTTPRSVVARLVSASDVKTEARGQATGGQAAGGQPESGQPGGGQRVQIRVWILDWLRGKGLDPEMWVHRGDPGLRPDGM